MKVLFFIGQLKEGGAERVISNIANELVNRDFSIEILVYYDREINYHFDNKIKITCVERNTNKASIIKNIAFIRKYFKNNADIIISFLAPFNIIALLANKNNNIPIIVADRNDPNNVPNKWYLRIIRNILYKQANAVVVQTKNNSYYFKFIKNNKLFVINNPINLNELAAMALNTTKNKKIVSIGRLMPQKNHLLLINSFYNVHQKHKDYILNVYGEGPCRKILQDRINELNANEYIKLCGEHNDVLNKILDAEIFVLSSDYEGMPNALLEAMCLGLPCISTNVSGSNELIVDNVNGLLVKKNNTEELEFAINKLIEDEKLRIRIAKNAIKYNELLNIKRITDNWVDLIKQISK